MLPGARRAETKAALQKKRDQSVEILESMKLVCCGPRQGILVKPDLLLLFVLSCGSKRGSDQADYREIV